MIIYKITNKKNGKMYIGQTLRSLMTRKGEHLRSAQQLERQKYPTPLHTAIRQQGSGDFTWDTLEVCVSCDHLNEREKFYIKLLGTLVPLGYNQTTGGSMDETMSESVRDRIAASVRKIHKDPAYRAKVYPKLKGLAPPNKGLTLSEEQKAKISAAKKAVYNDPTYINPNKGQKRTPEQMERLRAGWDKRELAGDKWYKAHADQYTPEVRSKMRKAKIGKKPVNTKKIMCIETEQVFDGLTEAAKALGINRQSIWLQIKGKLKSAGGLHFRYVDPV